VLMAHTASTTLGAVRDALRRGDSAAALALAEQLRAASADDPDVLAHLGLALKASGRLPEAVAALEASVARRPDHAATLVNLARSLRENGQRQRALHTFKQALAQAPGDAAIWSMLSNTERELGDPRAALASAQRALELAPELAEAHVNAAAALSALTRVGEACACLYLAERAGRPHAAFAHSLASALAADPPRYGQLVQALRADPAPLRLVELGTRLRRDGHRAAALYALELADDAGGEPSPVLPVLARELGLHGRAARRFSTRSEALQLSSALAAELGILYLDLKQPGRASAVLEHALAGSAEPATVLHNLALALQQRGRTSEAIARYRSALALTPERATTWLNLGVALGELGEPDEAAAALEHAVALEPHNLVARSNLLFTLNGAESRSAEQVFEAHRAAGAYLEAHVAPLPARARTAAARPLRVGYLSPDFRQHAVASYLLPVLRHHDRARVEVHCYADVAIPDDTTRAFASLATRFTPTRRMADRALAERIQEDRIDVLVDLAGHTSGNRMGVFALRPAPLQLAWLGYFASTGLTRIDYRLADAAAVPPEGERWFSERVYRLPRSQNCYAPPEHAPPVAPPPHARTGRVTFGCFNNPSKLSPRCLASFAAVLAAVPSATLLCKYGTYGDPVQRGRVLGALARHGIAPERVRFAGHSPMAEYLASMAEVDVMLDPFPYSGETTALHSLWMGVPVIAIEGASAVQRLASRVLRVAGLAELVASSVDDYVARAVALAHAAPRMAALRARIRPALAASPLLDHAGFTRELEDAYEALLAR
jgi:protein O-GlcNAc transferase